MYYLAPSFSKYEKIGEPFYKGKQMYIKVKHPNTGNVRDAKCYTEHDFRKAYPNEDIGEPSWYKTFKRVRGFNDGDKPISVLYGIAETDEYARLSVARYDLDFGWFFEAKTPVPADCPYKILNIYWDEIAENDHTLKNRAVIHQYLADKFKVVSATDSIAS